MLVFFYMQPAHDDDLATTKIREQLAKLQGELEQVLAELKATERKLDDSRRQTQKLLSQVSDFAAKEGRLRKEIAELSRALKGMLH